MLELEPRHLAMVRRILEAHVPDCEVRAFGSRVQGPAKPHSDLDLTVMTTSPLPIGVKVRLEHAFAESDLPFKGAGIRGDPGNDRAQDSPWLISVTARRASRTLPTIPVFHTSQIAP